MFLRDGVPVAGCMPKIPGVPEMAGPDVWGVYLSSEEARITVDKALASGGALRTGPMDIADAALARVAELGGMVISAAMDTPCGRLTDVADPTGTRFKLMSVAG